MREVMAADPITIAPEETIQDAADLMLEYQVSGCLLSRCKGHRHHHGIRHLPAGRLVMVCGTSRSSAWQSRPISPSVESVRHCPRKATMELSTVRIVKPDALNFILGQTHFIKSVEDLHEALVNSVPGIQFGAGFQKPLVPVWCAGAGLPQHSSPLPNKCPSTGCRSHIYYFPGRGLLSGQCVLNAEKCTGSLPDFAQRPIQPKVVIAATDQGRHSRRLLA